MVEVLHSFTMFYALYILLTILIYLDFHCLGETGNIQLGSPFDSFDQIASRPTPLTRLCCSESLQPGLSGNCGTNMDKRQFCMLDQGVGPENSSNVILIIKSKIIRTRCLNLFDAHLFFPRSIKVILVYVCAERMTIYRT